MMPQNNLPEYVGEKPPTKSQFAKKVYVITPLVSLAIVAGLICLTVFNEGLWDKQGFQVTIGALLGQSATGLHTQKDE